MHFDHFCVYLNTFKHFKATASNIAIYEILTFQVPRIWWTDQNRKLKLHHNHTNIHSHPDSLWDLENYLKQKKFVKILQVIIQKAWNKTLNIIQQVSEQMNNSVEKITRILQSEYRVYGQNPVFSSFH